MVDLATILGLVSAGKELLSNVGSATESAAKTSDAIRKILGNGGGETKALVTQLREQILDARVAQTTLKERLLELEEKVKKIDEFEGTRDRYVLCQTAPHSRAYRLKEPGNPEEKTRYLCQACFDDRQASILQFHSHRVHEAVLHCPRCQLQVGVTVDNGPLVMTAPRERRDLW